MTPEPQTEACRHSETQGGSDVDADGQFRPQRNVAGGGHGGRAVRAHGGSVPAVHHQVVDRVGRAGRELQLTG